MDSDPEESPLERQLRPSSGDGLEGGNDAGAAPVEDSNCGARSVTKGEDDPQIRNDPRFAKYFTMLKMVNCPMFASFMRSLLIRNIYIRSFFAHRITLQIVSSLSRTGAAVGRGAERDGKGPTGPDCVGLGPGEIPREPTPTEKSVGRRWTSVERRPRVREIYQNAENGEIIPIRIRRRRFACIWSSWRISRSLFLDRAYPSML